ncbi:MAG: cytochrome c [Anaerolineae bacterium]|nr:cytochrome c [Anaerolineae bacterium]
MKRVLKWLGLILAGLLGLLVVAAVILYALGTSQLNKSRDIQAEAISIHNNEAVLARGEQLAKGAALCTVCHGADLSGDVVIEDPTIGTVYADNLTGLGDTHTDADLIRAIRHGVASDGRQLLIMPSHIYVNMSAEDLGAMIAYLKSVPASGERLPEPDLSFMGRILLAAGLFGDVFPAELIDHNQPFPPMPEIGANVDYGAYLAVATGCTDCHGADLAGQIVDPTEPNSPWAPNLTPGGELSEWSEAEFIQAMRTGVSPHGHELDNEWMPYEAYASLEDDELRGLWLYLQSLPPTESAD